MTEPTHIHPTALIEPGAELDSSVRVGPYCVVGAGARIGKGCVLKSHVSIQGEVQLGEDNLLDSFVSMGSPPQDLSYKEEKTRVEIGDRNVFREFFSINRASTKEDGVTRVGSDNFFMSHTHVAHDCKVGNFVVLTSYAALPGHVEVMDRSFLSGRSAVFQFARVGRYAFLAGSCDMIRDLAPFMSARGRSEVVGPNLVGLRRAGFNEEQLRCVKGLYKIFYNKKHSAARALELIQEKWGEFPEAQEFIDFVKTTRVGVQR